MKYFLLLFFVIILACDGLNYNPNLNPNRTGQYQKRISYYYIMVVDQISKIPHVFYRPGLRLSRIGVNACEIIYYQMKWTFACDKAMYVMATGYRLLVTKEDYTRILEWIMPGTKIKFEKIKKNKENKDVDNN